MLSLEINSNFMKLNVSNFLKYVHQLLSSAHIRSATHVHHAHTFAIISGLVPQHTISFGAARTVRAEVCSRLQQFVLVSLKCGCSICPDSGFSFETDSQKNETSLKCILWIKISETALTNTFLFGFRFETKPKPNQVKLKLNLVSDSVNLASDSMNNRTNLLYHEINLWMPALYHLVSCLVKNWATVLCRCSSVVKCQPPKSGASHMLLNLR